MDSRACVSSECLLDSSAESSVSMSPSMRSSSSSRCIFGFSTEVSLAPVAAINTKKNAPQRHISMLSTALIHSQSSPNVGYNGSGPRGSCDGLQMESEINEPTCNSPLSPTAPIAIPTTTYFKEQTQIEERQRLQAARVQYRQQAERQLSLQHQNRTEGPQ